MRKFKIQVNRVISCCEIYVFSIFKLFPASSKMLLAFWRTEWNGNFCNFFVAAMKSTSSVMPLDHQYIQPEKNILIENFHPHVEMREND